MSREVRAYIYSLQDKKTGQHNADKVTIVRHLDDNNIVAEYKGVRCKAIFNWFTCAYYVDDVYGVIGGDDGVDTDQAHR